MPMFLFVFLFVCLSVCLLARLLENACMDFDEMLCVDRCRDMDLSGRLTLKPHPDHSPDARGTELLSPISYMRCYAEFYVGKIPARRYSEPWF